MVQAKPNLSDRQIVQASKAMSYLLRHGAEKEGLHMREDGYIYLNDLLEMKSLKSKRIGQAEIEYIVATNDKQRYELSEE